MGCDNTHLSSMSIGRFTFVSTRLRKEQIGPSGKERCLPHVCQALNEKKGMLKLSLADS